MALVPPLIPDCCYAASLYNNWYRVMVVDQSQESNKVDILLMDYHIYKSSYLAINIYDLPESLGISVIPPAVR